MTCIQHCVLYSPCCRATNKSMWYWFSRREDDYCIECSEDGVTNSQIRICRMWNAADTIQIGIYVCSPEDSSFNATFTNIGITPCQWPAHDGFPRTSNADKFCFF